MDTETTGWQDGDFNRQPIIEIGIVKTEYPSWEISATYQQVFSTHLPLDEQIMRDTSRLSAADLKGKPSFADCAHAIAEILDGSVLIAHNLRFDAGVMKYAFEEAGWKPPDFAKGGLCTKKINKGKHLKDACADHRISMLREHRALEDAVACAELARATVAPQHIARTSPIAFAYRPQRTSSEQGYEGYTEYPIEVPVENFWLNKAGIHSMPEDLHLSKTGMDGNTANIFHRAEWRGNYFRVALTGKFAACGQAVVRSTITEYLSQAGIEVVDDFGYADLTIVGEKPGARKTKAMQKNRKPWVTSQEFADMFAYYASEHNQYTPAMASVFGRMTGERKEEIRRSLPGLTAGALPAKQR